MGNVSTLTRSQSLPYPTGKVEEGIFLAGVPPFFVTMFFICAVVEEKQHQTESVVHPRGTERHCRTTAVCVTYL